MKLSAEMVQLIRLALPVAMAHVLIAAAGLVDTAVPIVLAVFAYWVVTLPLGWLLCLKGITGEPMGARGFWIALVVDLSVSGMLMTYRLWRTSRRTDLSPLPSNMRSVTA